MNLVILATMCSAVAFLSGIVTIGSGKHYVFTPKDILRGRCNAVMYVWLTFSSIFSLAHLASLIEYGRVYNWQYRTYDTGRWMAIHAGVAILLTTAHLFIKRSLDDSMGTTDAAHDRYLWGKGRVS